MMTTDLSKPISPEPLSSQRNPVLIRQFTFEGGLWVAVMGIALLARAWALGGAPLNDWEAVRALQALALARGEIVSPANPLFAALQAVFMSVFGADDTTARWLPALAGTLLCGLPALLRRKLGAIRALAFGALLALSPTLWFIARQSDGAQLAWSLAFGAWALWVGGAEPWRRPLGWLLAGLLLACGADAVTPALTVVIALAAGRQLAGVRPSVSDAGLAAAAWVLGATAFSLRLAGLGDVFNGYALWFAGLVESAPADLSAHGMPISMLRAMAGFLLYETLIWPAAVVGAALLIWDVVRPPQVTASSPSTLNGLTAGALLPWVAWIGAGGLLWLVTAAHSVDGLAPVGIGCAALAAVAVERLTYGLADCRNAAVVSAVAGMVAVMMVYGYLGLLLYAGQGQSTWLLAPLIAATMIAGIALATTLTWDVQTALAGVALAAGACLLVHTVGVGARLNHVRPDNPAEPYRSSAMLSGARDLRELMLEIGARASGEPRALSIELPESAPPAVRWLVRDWPRARLVVQPGVAELVLTPAPVDQRSIPLQTDNPYIGSAFDVSAATSIRSAPCAEIANCYPLARWLMLRTLDAGIPDAGIPDAGTHSSSQLTRWVLWLRQDVASRYSGR
ncbi:MAG: hypothetical protein RMN25_05805 [Anaerolineae bacterium]|nr:hypothetical protein [Thermoflexales bacterium]MDW8407280.1 hypothetical protein [Anaerolineae bacterium]